MPAVEEVAIHDNFIGFRSRNLLVERSATVTRRKESGCLIFLDQIGGDFRFTKNKGQRERF
jgi:hypothetical protein